MFIAVYILSCIGIATYMAHFWYVHPTSTALWITASVFAIYSVYAGIIGRARAEDERGKAILMAVTVIGCLVLLGLTLSAIFLFVPRIS